MAEKTTWNPAFRRIELLSDLERELIKASMDYDIEKMIEILKLYVIFIEAHLANNNGFYEDIEQIELDFMWQIPPGKSYYGLRPEERDKYNKSKTEAKLNLLDLMRRLFTAAKNAGLGIPGRKELDLEGEIHENLKEE